MHRSFALLLLPIILAGCTRATPAVVQRQPDITPIYLAPVGFGEYQRLKMGSQQPAGLPEALQAVHTRFCEMGETCGWDQADRWRFDQLAELTADEVVAQWATAQPPLIASDSGPSPAAIAHSSAAALPSGDSEPSAIHP